MPSGPEELWDIDPFKPEVIDDYLIGRGAADMKGAVATFLLAVKEFLNESGAESDWIWLDCFTLKPASYHILETLKSEGFKICVVSPELHIISRPEEWDELIFNFQDTLGGNVQFVDGICTKNPGIWALNSYSRTTNL